jgi:hypothetical protein
VGLTFGATIRIERMTSRLQGPCNSAAKPHQCSVPAKFRHFWCTGGAVAVWAGVATPSEGPLTLAVL